LKRKLYSKLYLLEELKRYGDKFGKVPTVRELKKEGDFPNEKPFLKYFGSWANALREAGLVNFNCIRCNKEFIGDSHAAKHCPECRKRQHAYLGLRFKVFNRDNFTCQYCGRSPLKDKVVLEVDHIHPKSKGGEESIDNYITACSECNIGKRDIIITRHKRFI